MTLWMLVGALMWLEVPLTSPQDLVRLFQMGMDVAHVDPKTYVAHVIVDDRTLDKLVQAGFAYTVLDYDLQATWRRHFKIGFGPYYTFAEVEARLQELVNLYGPQGLIYDTVIGYSVEGRPIHAFKISDNAAVDEDEPVVFLNGVHHAREPIGAYITLEFGAWLLDRYATDPEVRWLVDHREIWIVPVVNPDGFVYNEISDGYWRKNKRDNDQDGVFDETVDGVDLNRNYGFMWGYDDVGSSPNFGDPTYRGTAPFSEPETRAIRDLVNAVHPAIALNYHSYSNLLLFPYGYANGVYAPDDSLFRRMAAEMTRASGYTYATPWEILYTANGAADDWMYGDTTQHPRVLAFTPEVGEAFWQPDTAVIVEQFNENLPMNLFVTRAVGPYLEVRDVQATPATYQPGDTVMLRILIRNLYVGGGVSAVGALDTVASDSASVACSDLLSLSFSVALGPFPDSVWVELPVVVWDTSGAALYRFSGTLSFGGADPYPFHFAVPMGNPPVVSVFQDDFEGGLVWNVGGTGGNWGTASPGATGAQSLQDSPGGNYGNNWDTYVWTTVDLTGYTEARIVFTHRYALEDGYDYAHVEVSPDGQTWRRLASYTGSQTGWRTDTLDLSPVAGGVAWIRFRLTSDVYLTEDGWYVDDVQVLASAYGPPRCGPTAVVEVGTPGEGVRLVRAEGGWLLRAPNAVFPLRIRIRDVVGREVFHRVMEAPGRMEFRAPPGVYFWEAVDAPGRVRGTGRILLP